MAGKYYWEEDWIREDKIHTFNLRFKEGDFYKLKAMMEAEGRSVHKWCMDQLIKAMDKEWEGKSPSEKAKVTKYVNENWRD